MEGNVSLHLYRLTTPIEGGWQQFARNTDRRGREKRLRNSYLSSPRDHVEDVPNDARVDERLEHFRRLIHAVVIVDRDFVHAYGVVEGHPLGKEPAVVLGAEAYGHLRSTGGAGQIKKKTFVGMLKDEKKNGKTDVGCDFSRKQDIFSFEWT